jgi:hypothetical protein
MTAVIVTAGPPEPDARAALQRLNEFVGEWKGAGGPDKPRPESQDSAWAETAAWAWKFRGADAWLVWDVTGGKHVKSGELRYLPGRKQYRLTVTDPKGQKRDYTGHIDEKKYLVVSRVDPMSGETQQFTFNTAAEGVRLVYRYAVKPPGRTVFTRVYQVAANRAGESLAARGGSKGRECVVTGGLGTIPVTYRGQTYFVCCTGCRDAFNESPEKYVK